MRRAKRSTFASSFLAASPFALFALVAASASADAPVTAIPEAPANDADFTVPADSELRQHADRVADYTLNASLDPTKHVITGSGTIVLHHEACHADLRELYFHLYLNAFKNQSSVFLREPVGSFRGANVPKDWGYVDVKKLVWKAPDGDVDLLPALTTKEPGSQDETDARVALPREVHPDETITLDVAWESKLPTVVERTGYDGSFHMAGQWFPKLAKLEDDGTWAHFPFHHLAEFYADFGTYDVTLDVPESFTIGATGPTLSTRTENGRRIERHVQEDVHDFAWTAWDQWQRAEETIAGVDVTILFPPGFGLASQRELATMRFAIPHYAARYGPYPYRVLTLVHPPSTAGEAGGMEYPTLITTGGPWFSPPGLLDLELVTIHEFGHQYFYGLLASNELAYPFLDEGVNSYAEEEALSAWRGPGSVIDLLGLKVSDATIQGVSGRWYVHDARVAQSADAFETGNSYGGLVYERTGAIMETLRRVWGDETMQRALGAYARRFRFEHPTPEDFLKVMGGVMGERARGELHDALFQKGWVDYAITEIASQHESEPGGIFDRDGKRDTVGVGTGDHGRYTGRVVVVRRGTLSFPVTIELVREDGKRTRVPWDGVNESISVPYDGDSPLRAAIVDPDHAILVDQNEANNHALAGGGTPGSTKRTLERATYWSQLLLEALSP